MDARELLRQYLEQRREMGESEFVLDALTVEDAMRALGARSSEPRTAHDPADPGANSPDRNVVPQPAPRVRESSPPEHTGDWRSALRAAGAGPAGTPETPVRADTPIGPAAEHTPGSGTGNDDRPIVVGSASAELFGGPLSTVQSIAEIASLVAACKACTLYSTAKLPVPGEGNPNAQFVCVGEAPGATEDETGRPFVGRAGELLTKILEAINLKREDVFICNVLKHRPPGNRNPAPDEIAACRPFLMRQLELLRPRVILALGTFAAQTLLESKLAIGKLRGQVHTFYGIPLVVTYHPAALLRNPNWKRPTWEDVKLARRILDRTTDGT
jgi:uracil-DNA glycosylase family 4